MRHSIPERLSPPTVPTRRETFSLWLNVISCRASIRFASGPKPG